MIGHFVKTVCRVALVCGVVAMSALFSTQPASAQDQVESVPGTPEAPNTVIVEQPARAFGYVLGDKLVQRVLVDSSLDKSTLAEQLPLSRSGRWLERQFINLKSSQENKRWIEIGYQIIDAPTSLQTTSLPALMLVVNEDHSIELEAWPFTIGPLTPEQVSGEGDLLTLRPDQSVESINTANIERQLYISGLILGLLLLAWLGWWWWRQRKDAVRLPFAYAHDQLRKMGATHDSSNGPDAWVVLHHAFNQSAGRTLQAQLIPDLIQQQPWLAPLRDSIDDFFAASSARFFEQPARTQVFSLSDFSSKLYLAEKKHAA